MTHPVPSLFQIVADTPLWVWAVFALVLLLGLSRTRDRTLSVGRLLLLPAVMAALAISSLANAGTGALPAIVVGVLIGAVAGFLLERNGTSRRLLDGRIWLKGEWISLIQVLVVFAVRYANGVVIAVDPVLAAGSDWRNAVALLSAGLATLFVSRTAARLRVYYGAAA